MKLSTTNLEVIKNGIGGTYDLPLHGSQSTVRQVSFNRWMKHGKDRLYFNIQASKRQWNAGYIDLETGELVIENRHAMEFEDAMIILYALIADKQAEAQAEYENQHNEALKTSHDITESIESKISEIEQWLATRDGYDPNFSFHPSRKRFEESMNRQRDTKRNHLHALKIALSVSKKRGGLRVAGTWITNSIFGFEGLLEAIRGETEHEYI